MMTKQKKQKAGATPPLRKSYVYWLVAGLVLFGGMRHRDIARFFRVKGGRTSLIRVVSEKKETLSGQHLQDAMVSLLDVSENAKNRLMVVRYFITSTQSGEKTPEELLAWIPAVQAIYRDHSGAWRVMTKPIGTSSRQGRPVRFRVGSVIETEKDNPLRVVYVDEHSVLLCSVLESRSSFLEASLPITGICGSPCGSVLKVKRSTVMAGDHILFNGWECNIRTVARDRFEMAVKPMNTEEGGAVLMYQFVF